MNKPSGIYGIIVGNFAIILLVAAVVLLVLLLRRLEHSVDAMSMDRLQGMINVADEELQSFFLPVEENMRITRHRIEEGIFEQWDESLFTSYFYPLIHNSTQVSSVMLATPDGKELLILDLDTLVLNRITNVTAQGKSRLYYYAPDSTGILRKVGESADTKSYDPRSRPWFRLAMESPYDTITWTDPYSFFTTGEPGITAVLKWHNRQTGTEVLLAYDLLLKDISGFTTRMQPSKNSKVFVITEDNRCVGLPNDIRFSHPDSMVRYSLQNITQLQLPIVTRAVDMHQKFNYGPDAFNFNAGGESYWAGFKSLHLGNKKHFIIGSIVPESDFFVHIQDTKKQIYGSFALLLLIVLVLSYSYVQKRRDNAAIRLEKEKNESLLLNTLPAKVVRDLMETGKYNPERFEMISVMFADIVDFTRISAGMDAGNIIAELNDIYTVFDDIVERHGCERIKTIGDAYMAVCGMPEPEPDHAGKLLTAACEILEYIRHRNTCTSNVWTIRIGIHSGGVVGGIVGKKKYIYDIFGDTINTASRMESSAEPMRINISEATFQQILNKNGHDPQPFRFYKRPVMEIKGKGAVHMYFAEKQGAAY